MTLPAEFIRAIRVDVKLVLDILREQRRVYSLEDPYPLGQDIYEFYHSHSRREVKEGLELIREELNSTTQKIKEIGIFEHETNEEHDAFIRFFSWNPEDDKDEAIIDSCSVRIYLNPSFNFFKRVVVDLMNFYARLPEDRKAPLMFKMPFWKVLPEGLFERNTKLIIYANPSNNLIDRLSARLKQYPKEYFGRSRPLFTSKVRNGVGVCYDVKEKNAFFDFLQRITGQEDVYHSYGKYMALLIARGLQQAVMELGFGRRRKQFNFGVFSDEEAATVGTKTMVFVLRRCKADLDL